MIFWLACTPEPLPEMGRLPAFELQDHTGSPLGGAWFDGHVTVVEFMFTSCPDICPALTTRMSEIQAHYAGQDRVRLLSISVDPKVDTPPVLAEYAARFGADATRWRFVTGDADAVKAVVVDGFKTIMEPGDAPGKILHGTRFTVVDGEGDIRAFPDPKLPGEVEAAVDRLLAE